MKKRFGYMLIVLLAVGWTSVYSQSTKMVKSTTFRGLETDPIYLEKGSLVSVITPNDSSFIGKTLSVKISKDENANYENIYFEGIEYSIPVGINRETLVRPEYFQGASYVKFSVVDSSLNGKSISVRIRGEGLVSIPQGMGRVESKIFVDSVLAELGRLKMQNRANVFVSGLFTINTTAIDSIWKSNLTTWYKIKVTCDDTTEYSFTKDFASAWTLLPNTPLELPDISGMVIDFSSLPKLFMRRKGTVGSPLVNYSLWGR